jgi:hypothetical protein
LAGIRHTLLHCVIGGSNYLQPGSTYSTYDANGNLTAVTSTSNGNDNRSFVNDITGRALYAYQAGNVQRQMIVNGEVLGRYGVGINELTPRNAYGNPNFAVLADFDFNYQKITGSYPSASIGAYTIQEARLAIVTPLHDMQEDSVEVNMSAARYNRILARLKSSLTPYYSR